MHFVRIFVTERRENLQLEFQTGQMTIRNLDFASVLMWIDFLNYLRLPIIF